MGIEKSEKCIVIINHLKNSSQVAGDINAPAVFVLTMKCVIIEQHVVGVFSK